MGFIFLICTNNNIFGQLYTDNSIIVQKEELKIEKKNDIIWNSMSQDNILNEVTAQERLPWLD